MTPKDMKLLEKTLVALFGPDKGMKYIKDVKEDRMSKVFHCRANRQMMILRARMLATELMSLEIQELVSNPMNEEVTAALLEYLAKVADAAGAKAVHAIPLSRVSREVFGKMGFRPFPGDPRIMILRTAGPHKPVARRGPLSPATLARLAAGRRR
jgi:hypothetical protein